MSFLRGQRVLIKPLDEIANELGFSREDFEDGFNIRDIRVDRSMIQYFGTEQVVCDYGAMDNCVYFYALDSWWPSEFLKLLSKPGEFFGFVKGDLVEIKSMEEMRKDGSINYNWFTRGMNILCGEQCVITDIRAHNHQCALVKLQGLNIDFPPTLSYSTGMLKHSEAVPVQDIEVDDWAAVAIL